MAIRVHQLAKEIGLDNKELVDLLTSRGFVVKSVSSTIDNISAESLKAEFASKKTSAPAKAETPAAAPKPQIPPGAIVRSADDIAKERAARETVDNSKPKIFAAHSPNMPPRTPPMPPRPSGPPQVRLPSVGSPAQPPAIKFGVSPSSASGATVSSASTGSAAPSIVRPAQPPAIPGNKIFSPAQAASPSRTGQATPPSVPMRSAMPGIPSLPPIIRSPVTGAKPPFPINGAGASTGANGAAGNANGLVNSAAGTTSAGAVTGGLEISATPKELKIMQIKPPIIVRDFALFLGLKPFKLISSLMEMGIFASMNQVLEPELAGRIAEKFGVLLEIKHRGESPPAPPKKKELPKVDEKLLMEQRPPVVCILGHVDHGKTTLIDFIRKTNVVAGEAGGITQHIGAYQIVVKEKKITFLDTPGHSAFEKMRERGASVTDIAVLVIAADDGFKPQTDEALKHCRKYGLPVVVAINKADVKGANLDRVKKQMQERNLLPEEWGGETICVATNAVKGDGVDTLLEMLLLQAEMLELKANPKAPAEGVIVESKIEVGRGPTATVIVQKGTLKAGDAIVCGPSYCKVRSMLNERDEKLDKALPSTPVRIIGWSEAPEVGGHFTTAKNEREAKDLAEAAAEELLKIKRAQAVSDGPTNARELLEAITAQISKILPVVVKADVSGSLEAVIDALNGIKSSKVSLSIIGSSVGLVTLNDVEMAHTAKASIVAFNTRNETGVAAQLKHHQVSVISHNIIYELVEQVKDAMADLLDPILTEHVLGRGEIRVLFALTKGSIAGTMVTEGSLFRDKLVRVWRGKELVGQGKIVHMKRMKDDASEVKAGFECGILFSGIEGYKEGDTVECYEISKVKAVL